MDKLKRLLLSAALAGAGFLPAAAQEAVEPKPDAPQAAELKPDAPEAEVAVIAPSPVSEAELAFLKEAAGDKDDDVLELLLPACEDWLVRNPGNPGAPDIQLLKADLRCRLGDHKNALVDLLKYFQLYSGAPSCDAARRLYDTVSKKADKKLKPVLDQLAVAPGNPAADFNLSSLLEGLSVKAGGEYYEPLVAEYRYFFNRFPEYARNDMVRLSLAALHRAEKQYLASRLAYEKMIRLHPASPLLAGAKLSLAGLLADDLREYDKAIEVFGEITVSFPGTDEAWAAYGRLPALAQKQKKYDLAVEVYEKIIALYPDKEEAYGSYVAEAEVLRARLKKYPEAVAVLVRLADKYKGEKAVKALLLAAEIYRKDLKDSVGEISMYDRVAGEYQGDPAAPRSLYAAGEIYYKAKDADNARKYFDKLLMLYPEDALSRKATSRVADIVAGKI